MVDHNECFRQVNENSDSNIVIVQRATDVIDNL